MKAEYPRSSRAPEAAGLLPLLGLFLFMPPMITLFVAKVHIAGLPLIVVYLFGVWLALIACAAVLARRLRERPARGRSAEDQAPP